MLGTVIGFLGVVTCLWLGNWLAACWAFAFTCMAEAIRLEDAIKKLSVTPKEPAK